MSELENLVKDAVNYKDHARVCGNCKQLIADNSTDNFGPGDRCGRNPDINFSVSVHGFCDKWEDKSA